MHDRGADPDEVLAEIEAQLGRARAAGLNIAYFDEHMAFGWFPGVAERLDALQRREGLLRGYGQAARLPGVGGDFADAADEFVARLDAAEPGTYMIVGHPGHDTEEMRRLGHAGLAPGQVARDREGDTLRFTSPTVLGFCRAHGIEPTRFTDL